MFHVGFSPPKVPASTNPLPLLAWHLTDRQPADSMLCPVRTLFFAWALKSRNAVNRIWTVYAPQPLCRFLQVSGSLWTSRCDRWSGFEAPSVSVLVSLSVTSEQEAIIMGTPIKQQQTGKPDRTQSEHWRCATWECIIGSLGRASVSQARF